MEFLTVTELKNNMKVLIDQVAAGKSLTITKKGKPIAKIEPFKQEPEVKSWKKNIPKIKVKGIDDSTKTIREMRDQQ